METDFEKMYMDLNDLLQDICKFLTPDKLRVLSPKDKKLAESLINRCKVQLQEISKVQQPTYDEYVDMNNKKDDNTHVEVPFIEDRPVYPYKDLPAKDASQEVKYGSISMRRRFLLGFEKMKRVYAAVHNQWLLIYNCDKDLKPIFTFDLKNYEAKTENDRSTSFELLSTLSDKKVYHFMATTPKDKRQWIVHINNCHDNVILRNKSLRENSDMVNEDDDVGERYDCVISPSNYKSKTNEDEEDDGEDIYLELDDMVKPNQENTNAPPKIPPEDKFVPRPALLGRRPFRNLGIPVAPPTVRPLPLPQEISEDDDSLASYDDIGVQDGHIQEIPAPPAEDMFSDEDDDCTYEAFVDVQSAVNKLRRQISQEAEATENKSSQVDPNPAAVTDVPALSLKPKVKDKPPVSKKPLITLRSVNS